MKWESLRSRRAFGKSWPICSNLYELWAGWDLPVQDKKVVERIWKHFPQNSELACSHAVLVFLVGGDWNMNFIFPYDLGMLSSQLTNSIIFLRSGSTTNQSWLACCHAVLVWRWFYHQTPGGNWLSRAVLSHRNAWSLDGTCRFKKKQFSHPGTWVVYHCCGTQIYKCWCIYI